MSTMSPENNVTDITQARKEPATAEEVVDPAEGISYRDAQAIVYLLRRIRPKWSRDGIMAELDKLRDTPLAEAVIMAVACAQDEGNLAPVRITKEGPHQKRARLTHKAVAPSGIDYSPDCERHPGVKGHECAICDPRKTTRPGEGKRRESPAFRAAWEKGRAERVKAHRTRILELGLDPDAPENQLEAGL